MLSSKINIKANNQKGFTLIELLVVAPLAILVIAGIIALMVSLMGDVLISRERNSITFNAQDALNQVEQDIRLSTSIQASSGTLPSPQGSDSNFTGTAAFSSDTALVLKQFATTKNPLDPTRQLMFYDQQPNACASSQYTYNRTFNVMVIYYVYQNALWRRVVVPPYNTSAANNICPAATTPWQANSCQLGHSAPACKADDAKLTEDVDSIGLQYFTGSSGTPTSTAVSGVTTSARLTINSRKLVAGEAITQSLSTRATRTNDGAAEPAPTAPAISILNPGSITYNNPILATFRWTADNVANYNVSYQINGGAWSTPVDTTNTSMGINAMPNDVINIQVIAQNSVSSATSTLSTTLPIWSPCPLINGWSNYGGGYASAAFTMTSAKMVVVKGLVTGAPTGASVICNLPVGFRPTLAQIHTSVIDANQFNGAPARLDVYPSGDVMIFNRPTTNWLSLDGIRFMAPSANMSWITPATPYSNNWKAFDTNGGWQPLRYGIDSAGRAQIEGLLAPGTQNDYTTIATLPNGYAAQAAMHISAMTNSTVSATGYDNNPYNIWYNAVGIDGANRIYAKGIAGGTWESTQIRYFPSTYGGWTGLTFQNGWQNYDTNGFVSAAYTKATDGMVHLKGLIKNPGTGNGRCPVTQVIGNLPAVQGLRPAEKLIFISHGNGYFGRIDVWPNGNIVCISAYSGYTSLDNISFLGEQ